MIVISVGVFFIRGLFNIVSEKGAFFYRKLQASFRKPLLDIVDDVLVLQRFFCFFGKGY